MSVPSMVFHQDRSVGVEVFTLEAERVVITTNALGTRSEKIIRLTNLSPECEITRRRFGILYGWPLICAVVFSFASWKIAGLFNDAFQMLVVIPAACVPGFIYYAVRGFKPLEVTRFRDKNGNAAFELVETKKTRFAYADFIAELKKRIAQRAWN